MNKVEKRSFGEFRREFWKNKNREPGRHETYRAGIEEGLRIARQIASQPDQGSNFETLAQPH